MPWWWLLFIWLLLLLLCCPSVLLWMTLLVVWLWLSFDIIIVSAWVVDVDTAVMFKSAYRFSMYAEYGVLKMSQPILQLDYHSIKSISKKAQKISWEFRNESVRWSHFIAPIFQKEKTNWANAFFCWVRKIYRHFIPIIILVHLTKKSIEKSAWNH